MQTRDLSIAYRSSIRNVKRSGGHDDKHAGGGDALPRRSTYISVIFASQAARHRPAPQQDLSPLISAPSLQAGTVIHVRTGGHGDEGAGGGEALHLNRILVFDIYV